MSIGSVYYKNRLKFIHSNNNTLINKNNKLTGNLLY